MLRAFQLSIGQLGDPAILRVLAKSLLVTLLLFLGLAAALVAGVKASVAHYGWSQQSNWAALAATLALLAAGWLLFRAIAIPVLNFFADDVVAAVEARHYPQAAGTARPPGLGVSLRLGLGALARLLLFNLIALPGYVVLAVTGIGAVALFALVNALLLGRELGDMVAVRHLDTAARMNWLRQTRGQRSLLGLLVTGLFLLPLLNLLAPVIGAAMATHLFHGNRA